MLANVRKKKHNTLMHLGMYQERVTARREEIKAAVNWCKEQRCRGFKAISSGLFPLIKDPRTINKYIDGVLTLETVKQYCSILTDQEEQMLLKTIINKARSYQPMKRKDSRAFALQMLQVRDAGNQNKSKRHESRGGRGFRKLSKTSKRCLENNRVGRRFIRRFEYKYRKQLSTKRKGVSSLKRVMACSRGTAVEHIDDLATELSQCGIMKDAVKEKDGTWRGVIEDPRRVLNHDETPQFINYDAVDGTARNIFYCAKGERCSGLIAENRECVSISPLVTLGGDIPICHIMFASEGIKSNMAPSEAVRGIHGLLISSTEHGFQTGKSCLEFYKLVDEYLTENAIERPVCVLTDGHSSRFDVSLLRFCQEKQILQFVSPPDTTGLLQPLDQINSSLHSAYRNETENLFTDDHINRETFMVLLAKAWPDWAPKKTVVGAFKRCGITETKLDVDLMQQDKFRTAALITEDSDKEPTTPKPKKKKVWEPESPLEERSGSVSYWEKKYHKLVDNVESIIVVPVTPEELDLPGARIEKFRVKKNKNFRITSVYGSLKGKNILEKRELVEKENEVKAQTKAAKEKERDVKVQEFLVCKLKCSCEGGVCRASAYKQCSKCFSVIKSQCTKAACIKKNDGKKPCMITTKPAGPPPLRCRKKVSYIPLHDDTSSESASSSDESEHDAGSMISSECDVPSNRNPRQTKGKHDQNLTEKDATKKNVFEEEETLLVELWEDLSTRAEKDVVGNWFAAIYTIPKNGKTLLCVGRAKKRFLLDEGGNVDKLLLDCLKPRVGNNNFEEYPLNQSDEYMCSVRDVIGGPLAVVPIPGRRWRFPDYEKVLKFYKKVKDTDRKNIIF